MEKVFELYLRTTPERLWEAIVDPAIRARYQFGVRVDTELRPGGLVAAAHANAPGPIFEGEVLEVDAPTRLVHTMRALWSEEVKAEGFSRVTWEIEQVADSCRLILTHDELRDGANEEVYGGWPMILSGLKTWLESGELLTTPGSLMYGGADASS